MVRNIYEGNYNRLIIFPLILLAVAVYFIPQIKLGVDFTGGTLITLDLKTPVNAEELKASLASEGIPGEVKTYNTSFGERAEIEFSQNPDLVRADKLRDQFAVVLDNVSFLEVQANVNASVMPEYLNERKLLNNISNSLFELAGKSTRAESIDNLNTLKSEGTGAYRAVYDNYKNSISKSIDKYVEYSSLGIQTVSPALSAHFIDNAIRVAVYSIILTIIFVFIFFRSVVPSAAVVIGALCDIIIALGAMGLFGIPFTLASFAALLMILGFSLDTDILLTMRLLKRQGDARVNAFDALKTGMMMSITAIFSFTILFIIGSYTRISIYSDISAVALAGLVGDLFATWGINAVILLNHKEGRI